MAGDDVRHRPNGNGEATTSRSTEENGKELKNRPKPSALRQQKLPAWQPILTASTVLPAVICIGIVFIPIGVALFLASDSVVEVRVPYSAKCPLDQNAFCSVTIDIPKTIEGPVYFYYYLSNFFQNHRRYVKSRNDQQYLGNFDQVSECEPFDKDASGKLIVPCGAIANSMFNDTFELYRDNIEKVPFTPKGVLWDVDENRKFKNPDGWTQGDCSAFTNFANPPNWGTRRICEMEGGMQNVDFVVWMRTAALPNFRKLYRLLDQSADAKYATGLPQGSYTLRIKNRYDVTSFNGAKEFIISSTSWAGGKNSFLGIAYMVVGSLAILLGVIFIVIHIKFGHSVDELSNITRQ